MQPPKCNRKLTHHYSANMSGDAINHWQTRAMPEKRLSRTKYSHSSSTLTSSDEGEDKLKANHVTDDKLIKFIAIESIEFMREHSARILIFDHQTST